MKISIGKAKALCTANELALVELSGPKSLPALSAAQLRLKVTRARSLRDKWRDQAVSQRRAAQSKLGGRDAAAAGRSEEKTELFAEVLRRFESQLAKAEKSATPAKSAMAGKKTTKTVRSKEHRATRAEVRDELKQTKLGMKRRASSK